MSPFGLKRSVLSFFIWLGLMTLGGLVYSVALPEPEPHLEVTQAPASPAALGQPAAARGEFLGVVIADEAVEIAASGDGLVAQIQVGLGDWVEKGAVIATLDDRQLRDQASMAQASLRAARAEAAKKALELEEAGQRYARRVRLEQSGVAVLSEEEMAESRYQKAYAGLQLQAIQAQVAEKQAVVQNLQRMVSEATLRAPFAGRVAARYVDPGARVSRGTAIVRLLRAGQKRARIAVPDHCRISRGQVVAIRFRDRDTPVPGEITQVAPQVDPVSRLIYAEARPRLASDQLDALVLGAVVRVAVPGARCRDPARQTGDGLAAR